MLSATSLWAGNVITPKARWRVVRARTRAKYPCVTVRAVFGYVSGYVRSYVRRQSRTAGRQYRKIDTRRRRSGKMATATERAKLTDATACQLAGRLSRRNATCTPALYALYNYRRPFLCPGVCRRLHGNALGRETHDKNVRVQRIPMHSSDNQLLWRASASTTFGELVFDRKKEFRKKRNIFIGEKWMYFELYIILHNFINNYKFFFRAFAFALNSERQPFCLLHLQSKLCLDLS